MRDWSAMLIQSTIFHAFCCAMFSSSLISHRADSSWARAEWECRKGWESYSRIACHGSNWAGTDGAEPAEVARSRLHGHYGKALQCKRQPRKRRSPNPHDCAIGYRAPVPTSSLFLLGRRDLGAERPLGPAKFWACQSMGIIPDPAPLAAASTRRKLRVSHRSSPRRPPQSSVSPTSTLRLHILKHQGLSPEQCKWESHVAFMKTVV